MSEVLDQTLALVKEKLQTRMLVSKEFLDSAEIRMLSEVMANGMVEAALTLLTTATVQHSEWKERIGRRTIHHYERKTWVCPHIDSGDVAKHLAFLAEQGEA